MGEGTPNPNTTETTPQEIVDPTDTYEVRLLGYIGRAKVLLANVHRYAAYTSDVGEAFRPVAHPYIVSFSYAISWAYVLGDVLFKGHHAHQLTNDPKETAIAVLKRGVFQSLASMIFPAITIHTAVKYSAKFFRKAGPRAAAWGPTIVGLGIVPTLPFIFDEPIELAVEKTAELLGHKPHPLLEHHTPTHTHHVHLSNGPHTALTHQEITKPKSE